MCHSNFFLVDLRNYEASVRPRIRSIFYYSRHFRHIPRDIRSSGRQLASAVADQTRTPWYPYKIVPAPKTPKTAYFDCIGQRFYNDYQTTFVALSPSKIISHFSLFKQIFQRRLRYRFNYIRRDYGIFLKKINYIFVTCI